MEWPFVGHLAKEFYTYNLPFNLHNNHKVKVDYNTDFTNYKAMPRSEDQSKGQEE